MNVKNLATSARFILNGGENNMEEIIKLAKAEAKDNKERTKIRGYKKPVYDRPGIGEHLNN